MTVIDDPTTGDASTEALPRWDVSDIHESITARSVGVATEELATSADRLDALLDRHGIDRIEPRPATAADAAVAAEVIEAINAVMGMLMRQRAYVYSVVTTNSRDEAGQAAMSQVQAVAARLDNPVTRLAEWIAALTDGTGDVAGSGLDVLAAADDAVADHRGPLARLAARSEHQMDPGLERLYSDLAPTGSMAWTRLHADVTSQLAVDVELPTGTERLPITAVRGLANDLDPQVRRAALAAERVAWPTVAVPVAAALNAIKGEAITVNRRRRWASPLDASLFANSVSRPTFDAMLAAVRASLPDFRRWMQVKGALHGTGDRLHWADMLAPVPYGARTVAWSEGVGIVRDTFSGYGPQLARVLERAIDERWIDAEPRAGKVGGAFCAGVEGDRSLVLLNWSGSLDSTQTLAHELGHAFHNVTLAERTMLQRRLPMALAETASIFCETLVAETALASLDGDERLAVLDVDLIGSNQVVVDIYSRFLFETEVFRRREQRTLGVNELDEMMSAAQLEAYGDGLDQTSALASMWVLKPHYYSAHFYNWPYTYGLLFGLGLYSRYQEDPEHFRAGYETLLSRAGMDTAEQLGAAFDLDVTDEAFWTASLDVIRARIADYERLAAGHV